MTLRSGYPPQPYVAWLDFWIKGSAVGFGIGGDESLTLNAGRPVRFMGFDHKLTDSESGSWTLQLFDPEWDKVIKLLRGVVTSKVDPHARFQYYYTGPNKEQTMHSKMFNATILSATPTIMSNGLSLSIEGKHLDFVAHQTQETSAHTDADKSGKSISRIVMDIIDKHADDSVPWVAGTIVDTEPVLANRHVTETKPRDLVFQQKNISDLQFINKTLIPHSVSKGKRVGNYVFFAEDKSDHYLCHYRPRTWYANTALRVFSFMWGDKNSEVISFSPEVKSAAYLNITGGGEIKMNSSSSTGPSTKEITVNQLNTAGKLLTGQRTVGSDVDGSGVTGRNIADYAINTDMAKIQLTAKWQEVWESNNRATLVVQGNPNIMPLDYIKVIIWMPGKVPNEFSGVWQVREITHTIQPGKFESSMELERQHDATGIEAIGELMKFR